MTRFKPHRARAGLTVRLLAVALALGLAGGCATQIAGQPSPAPVETPTELPTTADPTPAPDVTPGNIVEAHRIAGATVQPQFVFPELDNSCLPTLPIIRAENVEFTIFASGTAAATYTKFGFVAGFSSCRNQLDGPRSAIAFVAEMSDPDSAAVAAVELAGNFEASEGSIPVGIPGFENLPAVMSSTVVDGQDEFTLEALQPVGRMLAYFYYTDNNLEQAQDDLGELLEEQRQLLSDFEPTPQEEVAGLDPDPYDLADRTATPPGDLDLFSGSFDLPGYLHLAIDPQQEAELLPANGFVGLYNRASYDEAGQGSYQFQTYELGSLTEADAVFAEFTRIEQEEYDDRVMFMLPEDPTIPCFYIPPTEAGEKVYQRCYSRVGAYLGLTDVYVVTDPADITAIRGYVQQQIALMAAP